jgi:hypothetical protein
MHLPSKFYRVAIVSGGGNKRYWQRGGQTFVQLLAANISLEELRRQGVECELYESEPVVWNKISTGSDS